MQEGENIFGICPVGEDLKPMKRADGNDVVLEMTWMPRQGDIVTIEGKRYEVTRWLHENSGSDAYKVPTPVMRRMAPPKSRSGIAIEIGNERHELEPVEGTGRNGSCAQCSLDEVCNRFKNALCNGLAGYDDDHIFVKQE